MLNVVVDEGLAYVGYLAIVRHHCKLFMPCVPPPCLLRSPQLSNFDKKKFSGNLARALGNILRRVFIGTFAKL